MFSRRSLLKTLIASPLAGLVPKSVVEEEVVDAILVPDPSSCSLHPVAGSVHIEFYEDHTLYYAFNGLEWKEQMRIDEPFRVRELI